MKLTKYIYNSAVAMLVATISTACSENEILTETAPEGGEVEYMISTTLPDAIQTYTSGTGTDVASQSCLPPYNDVNSALGGLANLVDQGYAVRYIMEIYNPEGRLVRQIKYKPLTSGTDYRSITFDPVRIVRSDNTEFLFWADIVMEVNRMPAGTQDLEGAEEMNVTCDMTGITLPYYANPYFYSNKDNKNDGSDPLFQTIFYWTRPGDLHHISGSCPYVPDDTTDDVDDYFHYNSEMWDGYSAYKKFDSSQMQGGSMNITLTRPLAKLRFVTTDADIIAGNVDEDFNWGKTRIELNSDDFSKEPIIPSILPSYNMASGKAELFPDYNWVYSHWQMNEYVPASGQPLPIYSADTNKCRTIAVVYVPGQSQAINLKAYIDNHYSRGYNFEINLNLPNVPLVANKLTTIKGNFLSKDHNFSITVSDDFDTPGEDVVYTGTPVSGD